MLGVALVSWGTVTHSWDASTKTLTVQYTADGVDLNFDNILNQYGASGQVKKLVISGDFTNTEWTQKTCGFIEQCAGQNTLDLDMTGCTKLVSRFVNVKDTYNAETDWADTYFNQFTQDQLTKVTKYYYWGQSEADPDKVYQKNGKWYVDMGWGDGNPEVTPTETYVYQFEDGTTGNVQAQNGVYTLVNDFSFGNAKTKIKSVKFPASSNFTYIPDELFSSCSNVQSVYLPDNIVAIGNKAFMKTSVSDVNFPNALKEIGGDAFEHCNMTSVDLSNTQVTLLRWFTFQDCAQLESFVFPTALTTIEKNAFEKSGLKTADLSDCHSLTIIGHDAFNECYSLTEVKLCSHPKVIKGGASGAFHNCTAIRTVEVVGCDGTDVTQCVCENRAFEWDVTHVQTAVANVETMAAKLIYPRNMALDMIVKSSNTPYTSTFDYFVGDYKAGAVIKQENLLAYYRQVPTDGYGTTKDENEQEVKLNEPTYKGNGWLEFINVGEFVPIIPKGGKFLRTYSLNKDYGPVLLPIGDDAIHAYRVLDYKSLQNETDDNGNEITVTGYLLLKELLTTVKGVEYSYVPENTGVVFYSNKLDETAALVLAPYMDDELENMAEAKDGGIDKVKAKLDELFPEFPNTGDDYYCLKDNGEWEGNPDANMLQGSYDDPAHVSPTSPWIFKDDANQYPYGGYYEEPRLYRNFSLDATNQVWKRMKVGYLRANRAFAQLPVGRFNNENENADMNKFNAEDNGLEAKSAINMIFDGEATSIVTVDNRGNIVDDDAWYTIQGVRVTVPTKGVYIHNHKKVVIK